MPETTGEVIQHNHPQTHLEELIRHVTTQKSCTTRH
jgi:hypothetical protein